MRQRESSPSLALVLGAGASVDSGVPLTRSWIPLLWRWFDGTDVRKEHVDSVMQMQDSVQSYRDYGPEFTRAADAVCAAIDSYDRDWLEHHPGFAKEEYTAFMDWHEPRRQQEAIQRVLSACHTTISQTYLRIANLVRAGYVDTILTTNFDGIIAKAIHRMNIHPLECSYDDESSLCSPSISHPLILYLHGNQLKYNMRNTLRTMQRYGTPLKNLIRDILKERALLVCGYSGWDDGLMAELRDWFGHTDTVTPPFFCYWTFYTKRSMPCPLAESDYVHLIENAPANTVFERLSTYLGLDDSELARTLRMRHDEVLSVLPDSGAPPDSESPQQDSLDSDPNRAILRLLSAGERDQRPIHAHLDHPLRLIDDWCKCGYSDRHHAIERKTMLLTHLEQWTNEWGDLAVVARAIPSVTYPGIEGTHINQDDPRTFTFIKGPLELSQISELSELWPRVRDLLKKLGAKRWTCYRSLTHPWVYPGSLSPPGVTEEVRDAIHAQARVMLRDLSNIAEGHSGILSNIREDSRTIGANIRCDIDPEFRVLFPLEARKAGDWDRRNRRLSGLARKLADRWANSDPATVCHRISTHYEQARQAEISWPDYTRFVCQLVADQAEDPVHWAINLIENECDSDLVEEFSSKAIKHNSPGINDLIIRCVATDRYRAAAVLPILCVEQPSESLLSVALSHTMKIERPIERAVLFNRVSRRALRALLDHPFDAVAGTCAVAAWGADPEGHAPNGLEENWRRAIVRCVDDEHHQLALILDRDGDIAFNWMVRNLFREDPYRLDKEILACASRLSVTRRRKLLAAIPAEWSLSEAASVLIGQDAELYSDVLDRQDLELFHLAPLYGKIIPRFVELAHDAGYSERDLAGAVYCEKAFAFHGPESLMWQGRIEYLSSFLDNDLPIVRRVAGLAIEAAESEKKRAEEHERDR